MIRSTACARAIVFKQRGAARFAGQQATAISEDPTSGKLLLPLLGFELPVFREKKATLNTDALFTTPLLLTITQAESWPASGIQAAPLSGTDLGLPVSMVCLPCNSPADFNDEGHVDRTDPSVISSLTMPLTAWACAANSSDAEADSSAPDAFCCVTLSIWETVCMAVE